MSEPPYQLDVSQFMSIFWLFGIPCRQCDPFRSLGGILGHGHPGSHQRTLSMCLQYVTGASNAWVETGLACPTSILNRAHFNQF